MGRIRHRRRAMHRSHAVAMPAARNGCASQLLTARAGRRAATSLSPSPGCPGKPRERGRGRRHAASGPARERKLAKAKARFQKLRESARAKAKARAAAQAPGPCGAAPGVSDAATAGPDRARGGQVPLPPPAPARDPGRQGDRRQPSPNAQRRVQVNVERVEVPVDRGQAVRCDEDQDRRAAPPGARRSPSGPRPLSPSRGASPAGGRGNAGKGGGKNRSGSGSGRDQGARRS